MNGLVAALLVLLQLQLPHGSVARWVKSSPATPLPKNAVLISNATLNPVPVYECAVKNSTRPTKYVAGALAYEGAWRCAHLDLASPSGVSAKGPGQYEVYVDTFGSTKQAQATAATPFPKGTITPLFSANDYYTGARACFATTGTAAVLPAAASALSPSRPSRPSHANPPLLLFVAVPPPRACPSSVCACSIGVCRAVPLPLSLRS